MNILKMQLLWIPNIRIKFLILFIIELHYLKKNQIYIINKISNTKYFIIKLTLQIKFYKNLIVLMLPSFFLKYFFNNEDFLNSSQNSIYHSLSYLTMLCQEDTILTNAIQEMIFQWNLSNIKHQSTSLKYNFN